MKLSQVDPSMALNFYCKNEEEFDDFCHLTEQVALPSLISQDIPLIHYCFFLLFLDGC